MTLTEIDYDELLDDLDDDDTAGELLGRDDTVERVTVAEAKRRYRDFVEV